MRYGEGSGNAYIMPKTDYHCNGIYKYIRIPLNVDWLFCLRRFKIAIFRQYRELKAGDYKSLKSSRRNQESNSGPNCPASKELDHYITAAPPLNVSQSGHVS